jgi:hypothetical protein
MVASVRGEKIQVIADAIDESTAGTAKASLEFEQVVQRIMSANKP